MDPEQPDNPEVPDRFKQIVQSEALPVCPFLGCVDDPHSHARYASGRNLCYAFRKPARIRPDKQRAHCLTRQHPLCETYQNPATSPRR
jgi:hypothetical protein